MNRSDTESLAGIPMRDVGPVMIRGPVLEEEHYLPLATFEKPLWPSVTRGARAGRQAGGIHVLVTDERMTRSVLVQADSAAEAHRVAQGLREDPLAAAAAVEKDSRHTRFLDIHSEVLGDLLFLRLAVQTGDAAGHNMVTAAADRLLDWLLDTYPRLRYISVSANLCADKKNAAVNGMLGRGRRVIAEALLPETVCRQVLRVTPSVLAELVLKKNWIGSVLAGSVRSANAHFANMLLAFYLATGQDGANIVEGSQGFVHAEARGRDLYFSVTLPHIVIGAVGAGKGLPFVRANLERLDCLRPRAPGMNARRLAAFAGAAVWCGELSLLAALTQRGKLMEVHRRLERAP